MSPISVHRTLENFDTLIKFLSYLILSYLSKSCHLACASKFNPIKIVPAVTYTLLSIKFVNLRRR